MMLRSAVVLSLLLSASATPQTLFKGEVDGLIRGLRYSAADDGTLGGDGARSTAMVLAAAGHCHRHYHAGDGPWISNALRGLFLHRRADGGFGEDASVVETTQWVLEALRAMDPQRYRDEIASAAGYLERSGAEDAMPLRAAAVAIAADGDDVVAAARARAAEVMADWTQAGAPAGEVVGDLVALVACQMAARGDAPVVEAAATPPPAPWTEVQQRGYEFLLTQQEDGVFGVEHGGKRYPDVGLTGLGVAALLTKPAAERSETDTAAIEGGLAWLRSQQNDDGSFSQQNVNYSTCAAVMALAAAGVPDDAAVLTKAREFLLALQNVEARGYSRSDRDYGSLGYGGDERGDLSNLQFALQALRDTGLSADDEAFEKALVFLQRTQNRRASNDFEGRTKDDDGAWQDVAPGDDGGAAYYPGNSPAGYETLPDGTRIPRSYGSMTYALLKAYILAGLPADDPRVQAAVGWIQNHWTLAENPGADPSLPKKASYQGLYYYYMVLAQALDLAGIDRFAHEEGEPIDWRAELRAHLASVQRDDGSWVNAENGRWWEDQPLVCTTYVLLALARCAE